MGAQRKEDELARLREHEDILTQVLWKRRGTKHPTAGKMKRRDDVRRRIRRLEIALSDEQTTADKPQCNHRKLRMALVDEKAKGAEKPTEAESVDADEEEKREGVSEQMDLSIDAAYENVLANFPSLMGQREGIPEPADSEMGP